MKVLQQDCVFNVASLQKSQSSAAGSELGCHSNWLNVVRWSQRAVVWSPLNPFGSHWKRASQPKQSTQKESDRFPKNQLNSQNLTRANSIYSVSNKLPSRCNLVKGRRQENSWYTIRVNYLKSRPLGLCVRMDEGWRAPQLLNEGRRDQSGWARGRKTRGSITED